MILQNEFNFFKLISYYSEKTALIIGNSSYSYQQLSSLVKKRTKKYTTHFKRVFVVKSDSIINFIIDFFAIIESGNYPFVTDSFTSKKTVDFGVIPAETMFLASTSGTTGQPKIYYRDWNSWSCGFDVCNGIFLLDEIKILATTSPLNTSLGLHTMLCSLYLGKIFSPITSPSQLANFKGTAALFTVPTYFMKFEKIIHSLSSLDTLFVGGGTLKMEAINQIKKQLPFTKIIEFYGSSETSFISWQRVDCGKNSNCVGALFPNTQVKLGEDHTITVKSPYLFSGYANQDKPSSWTTDDLGYLRDDNLYLLGRKSDIIEHGANKIFPQEIEQMAKDLCENCVAFGISDKKYGQKIALLLVRPIKKERLLKILMQRLPKYKLPEIYLKTEFLFLTDNQKISRKKLEEDYLRGVYHDF